MENSLINYKSIEQTIIVKLSITELWSIVNIANQVFKIYPLAGIDTQLSSRIEIIQDLANFHNLFESMDKLILFYLSSPQISDSVLGDFRWCYRESFEKPIAMHFCKSGIALGPGTISPFDEAYRNEYEGGVGLYGLELIYKKPHPAISGEYIEAKLSIDKVVSAINDSIAAVELGYTKLYNQAIKGDPEAFPGGQGVPAQLLVLTSAR